VKYYDKKYNTIWQHISSVKLAHTHFIHLF